MGNSVSSGGSAPSAPIAIPEFYNIAADICDRQASTMPEAVALTLETDEGLERWTWRQIREGANRLANVLASLGVGAGDRVAIVIPVGAPVLFAHFACWKLGAISCPMSILFGPDALGFRFADADVSAIITDSGRIEAVKGGMSVAAKSCQILLSDGVAPGTIDMRSAMADASPHCETAATRADDPAYINYTSGTTGHPKGALAAHRAIPAHLSSTTFLNGAPEPGDVYYSPADWAWLAGMAGMLCALHDGRMVAARRQAGFDPVDTLRFLSEHRVTAATLMPTMLRMMATIPDDVRAQYPLCLRAVVTGSEAVGAELYEWVGNHLGVPLGEAYGQTECNAAILSSAAHIIPRPGSLGMPGPGFDVCIVDDEGNPLPSGEVGQIGIRAGHPIMMLGYWRNPEATESKFAKGWMLTGDLGRCDEDGYFWFVGRTDDVINASGYRIGPVEIEECLQRHPAVYKAAVIGVPDTVRNESIKAFVILQAGVTGDQKLVEELRDFVRSRLARHEVPRDIEFRDALPTTVTGKVIRAELKREFSSPR